MLGCGLRLNGAIKIIIIQLIERLFTIQIQPSEFASILFGEELEVHQAHALLAGVDDALEPGPALDVEQLASGKGVELDGNGRTHFVRFVLKWGKFEPTVRNFVKEDAESKIFISATLLKVKIASTFLQNLTKTPPLSTPNGGPSFPGRSEHLKHKNV
jgi:hypothetical protein